MPFNSTNTNNTTTATSTNNLSKQTNSNSPSSQLNLTQSPPLTTATTASLLASTTNPILSSKTSSSSYEQAASNGNDHHHHHHHHLASSSTFPSIQFSNPPVCSYSEDANKAFDDVVFDILRVDPDHIAGQLTLIDLPLFKLIEPDELISCKWMSREKLLKAPNIVQFTRRFNQTAFWCQKEILNCKRIERRGKMITHFIKIAKRLNELHSFNSLMAIVVALKSAPIYRLKKTWSQHVAKRDVTFFERMSDLMFDTSDNKRKIRDMHMNCKLPCIPFLGLFLTDLIHIDIAHPHNAFDNPQRRNQMNNICRLISEYQQSNYQDLTLLSCSCCFNNAVLSNQSQTEEVTCITPNCSCDIHHGHSYGGGIINNDGTIYISEMSYVKNYLNSFLYIEELQKFKEDDNYRESLELEPDPVSVNSNSHNNVTQQSDAKLSDSLQPSSASANFITSSPCKLNSAQFGLSSSELIIIKPPANLINETKDLINDLKLKHPLDDSIVERTNATSILPATNTTNSISSNAQTSLTQQQQQQQQQQSNLLSSSSKTNLDEKSATNNNKLNDPSLLKSVLRQRHINGAQTNSKLGNTLCKQRELNINDSTTNETKSHHHYLRNKFNCYSSNSADVDDTEDDDDVSSSTRNHVNTVNDASRLEEKSEISFNNDPQKTPVKPGNLSFDSVTTSSKKTGSKQNNSIKNSTSRKTSVANNNNNDETSTRRPSGRNLTKSLNDENVAGSDRVDSQSNAITPNLSNSDLWRSSLHNDTTGTNRINNTDLSSLSSILGGIEQQQQQMKAVVFESPVKRKCIIKNYRKPRFSQWKTYWLQLIGGNLLVYYPTKSVINGLVTSQRRNSTTSNNSFFMVDQFQLDSNGVAGGAGGGGGGGGGDMKSLEVESTCSIEQQQKQEKLTQLQTQLQQQKVLFNKNPCKMHPIASWMVVNLFQDKENEMLAQLNGQHNTTGSPSSSSSTTNNNNNKLFSKFDIQLNDLNNGNMYKYRFDSLHLAKEWFEQFKLASTFHERQKPDNLIRFD